ncbi:MAG: hypothetical protein WBA17_11165 [Saprospiraceae bacterium]
MENGILTENQQKDAELIEQIIKDIVTRKGYQDIKANVEGYETPAKIRRSSEKEEFFIPDVTGELNGRKSYFEVALKTDDERELVTKWKLLSSLAGYKNGKLFLAVPRGHMAFTNRILEAYTIKAEIIKI